MVIKLRPGEIVTACVARSALSDRSTVFRAVVLGIVDCVTEHDIRPAAVLLEAGTLRIHRIESMWLSNGEGTWWWPTIEGICAA